MQEETHGLFFRILSHEGHWKLLVLGILVLFTGLYFALFCYSTMNGVGLNKDTATYFSVASSLSVMEIPPAQAPFYYFLLMAGAALGISLRPWAWCINASCVLMLPAIVYWGMWRCFSNRWLALWSAIAVPCLHVVFSTLCEAQTEPVYFLFQMGGLFCLVKLVQKTPKSSTVLAGATICAAGAALTRYIGVTMILALGIAIAARPSKDIALKRIVKAMGICCLASIPLLAYVGFNHWRGVEAAGHSLQFVPISPKNIELAESLFLTSFVPYKAYVLAQNWAHWISILALSLIVFGAIKALHVRVLLPWLAYLVLYMVMLVATIIFSDAQVHPGERFIALPMSVVLLLMGLACFGNERTRIRRGGAWGLICILLIPVVVNGMRLKTIGLRWHRNGIGYAAVCWNENDMMRMIPRLVERFTVYTDTPSAVQLHTGCQTTHLIPRKVDPVTQQQNGEFKGEMEHLRDSGSLVVIFRAEHSNDIEFPYHMPNVREMIDDFGLRKIADTRDGTILGTQASFSELNQIAMQCGVQLTPSNGEIVFPTTTDAR